MGNTTWISAEVIGNLVSLGADEDATRIEVNDAMNSGTGNVVYFRNISFEYVGGGAWHRFTRAVLTG